MRRAAVLVRRAWALAAHDRGSPNIASSLRPVWTPHRLVDADLMPARADLQPMGQAQDLLGLQPRAYFETIRGARQSNSRAILEFQHKMVTPDEVEDAFVKSIRV